MYTGMTDYKKICVVLTAILCGLAVQARDRKNFDGGWDFLLNDKLTIEEVGKVTDWRRLDLPHDWGLGYRR